MPAGDTPVEPLAYLNGRFLPFRDARLALNDAGFILGATITDMCRTFAHKVFRWADHLDRFRRGCRYADIDLPLGDEEFTARADELVARNARLLPPGGELALVLFATPGPVGIYAGEEGGAGDGAPTFGMHTFPMPWRRYRPLFEQGVRVVVPEIRHVPATSVDPRFKQRSRLHWWLAERQARKVDPGATPLLLDADGHVTETAGANFLIVQKGAVVSPPQTSILEGVSIRVVRELCGELGISYREQPLGVSDCLAADEALLASTPFCVAGVSRINGTPIPWPGTVLNRLLDAWGKKVGTDIRGQFLE